MFHRLGSVLFLLPTLPFLLSSRLPTLLLPSSSHHSKMLPGPMFVVMVTKTGGNTHVTGTPCALIGQTHWNREGGTEGRGGGDVTHPPVHEWEGPSLRLPESTHRHNGCFFKVGLSRMTEVELLGSQGWFYLLLRSRQPQMKLFSITLHRRGPEGRNRAAVTRHMWAAPVCGCCLTCRPATLQPLQGQQGLFIDLQKSDRLLWQTVHSNNKRTGLLVFDRKNTEATVLEKNVLCMCNDTHPVICHVMLTVMFYKRFTDLSGRARVFYRGKEVSSRLIPPCWHE